jgi:hypothetical protein
MRIINGSKRQPGGPPTRRTSSKGKFAPGAIAQEIPPTADPDGKHPGGRPTKRTPEITTRIAEAISYGLTDEEAAALVGIDDDTLTQMQKYRSAGVIIAARVL